MAMQQLTLPSEVVKKSNALARGRWQPKSIWEPRIVALVASKVRTDDEDFFTYKIPVAELTGLSDENLGGLQYREIEKSIAHLGKATIRIDGEKPRSFRQYNIFSMCGYENGHLIARFDPDLKPHFLNLKACFTEYSLMELLSLPSTYSQGLFELLKSWSKLPEYVVSVAELHEILDTPSSFRNDFRQFRIRVLEKAHADITAHTSFHFDWEPVKVGRSVERIRFLFAGNRRELAAKVKEDARREKQSRLNNSRFLRAVQCAQAKHGNCTTQDNRPIICKMCRRFDMCASARKL